MVSAVKPIAEAVLGFPKVIEEMRKKMGNAPFKLDDLNYTVQQKVKASTIRKAQEEGRPVPQPATKAAGILPSYGLSANEIRGLESGFIPYLKTIAKLRLDSDSPVLTKDADAEGYMTVGNMATYWEMYQKNIAAGTADPIIPKFNTAVKDLEYNVVVGNYKDAMVPIMPALKAEYPMVDWQQVSNNLQLAVVEVGNDHNVVRLDTHVSETAPKTYSAHMVFADVIDANGDKVRVNLELQSDVNAKGPVVADVMRRQPTTYENIAYSFFKNRTINSVVTKLPPSETMGTNDSILGRAMYKEFLDSFETSLKEAVASNQEKGLAPYSGLASTDVEDMLFDAAEALQGSYPDANLFELARHIEGQDFVSGELLATFDLQHSRGVGSFNTKGLLAMFQHSLDRAGIGTPSSVPDALHQSLFAAHQDIMNFATRKLYTDNNFKEAFSSDEVKALIRLGAFPNRSFRGKLNAVVDEAVAKHVDADLAIANGFNVETIAAGYKDQFRIMLGKQFRAMIANPVLSQATVLEDFIKNPKWGEDALAAGIVDAANNGVKHYDVVISEPFNYGPRTPGNENWYSTAVVGMIKKLEKLLPGATFKYIPDPKNPKQLTIARITLPAAGFSLQARGEELKDNKTKFAEQAHSEGYTPEEIDDFLNNLGGQ